MKCIKRNIPGCRWIFPQLTQTAFNAVEAAGNGDGRIDAGETGSISVTLTNGEFYAAATEAQATLSTTVPGITITDSTAVLGTVNPGQTVTNTTDLFGISVAPGTPVQWAPFTVTVTAAGDYRMTSTFRVRIGRPGLILVQSDSTQDLSAYYTNTLDSMGVQYDKWDVDVNTLPEEEFLRYTRAFWFTGMKGGVILTEQHRSLIESFLAHGNKLMLSSQNALEYCVSVDSSFAIDVLHANLVLPQLSKSESDRCSGRSVLRV